MKPLSDRDAATLARIRNGDATWHDTLDGWRLFHLWNRQDNYENSTIPVNRVIRAGLARTVHGAYQTAGFVELTSTGEARYLAHVCVRTS